MEYDTGVRKEEDAGGRGEREGEGGVCLCASMVPTS